MTRHSVLLPSTLLGARLPAGVLDERITVTCIGREARRAQWHKPSSPA